MTTHLRSLRLSLVAAGFAVAAPSFASTVTPLCGGEKGAQDEKHDDKPKTDNNKKTDNQPKKPTNPA
jgi:hypothetical protein